MSDFNDVTVQVNSLLLEPEICSEIAEDPTFDGVTAKAGDTVSGEPVTVFRRHLRRPRADETEDLGLNRRRGGLTNRLFVGGLPFGVYEERLANFFGAFGKVKSCQVIRERSRGHRGLPSLGFRSKGFGFVVYEDVEGVQAAIEASARGLVMDGRSLNVDYAKSKTDGLYKAKDTKVNVASSGLIEDAKAESTNHDKSPNNFPVQINSTNYIKESNKCQIDDLPDDALRLIFAVMPIKERVRSEIVCKRWRQVSIESWQCLTRFSIKEIPTSGSLWSKNRVDDALFRRLLHRMRCTSVTRLEHLDLSRSGFGRSSLEAVAKLCPRLTSLDISGVLVSEDSLRSLASQCKAISVFSLEDAHDLTEHAAWYILKDLVNLQNLNLSGCQRITGNFFHLANDKLTYISLARCRKLKDDSVLKIALKCPNLRSLDLSSCFALTANAFEHIAKMKSLRHLSLANLSHLVEIAPELGLMLSSLPLIEELDLSGNDCVVQTTLDAINTANLQKVNLSSCRRLNRLPIAMFATHHCPQLKHLNLSYVELDLECHDGDFESLTHLTLVAIPFLQSNSASFDQILTKSPKLTFCDISGNLSVDDRFKTSCADASKSNAKMSPELTLQCGGTSLTVPDQSDQNPFPAHWRLVWTDSSNFYMRQDQAQYPRRVIYEDDSDDEFLDYGSDYSDSGPDDFEDLDHFDPVANFERNWMS